VTSKAIRQIEERLTVALPPPYVELLRKGKPDFFRATGMFRDPERILIANLQLRDPDTRGWRETWPHGFVMIGEDGCGGMLFTGTKPAHVHYWDHETDTFEDLGTWKVFIDKHAKLAASPPDFDVNATNDTDDELVVTRVKPSWKSILDPIRLDEWKAYVATDESITWRGYREARSPFDGKKVRFPYPGLARWKSKTMGNVELLLAHGRIGVMELVDPRKKPTKEAKTKLTRIAKALHAHCLGDHVE